MISNPVVVKKGGGQVYSITSSIWGFPESAEAGQFVVSENTASPTNLSITDSKGNTVPFGSTTGLSRAANQYCYFVMPASDVTIS